MRLVVLPPRRGSLVSVVMMVEGGRGEELWVIVTRKHLLERRKAEVTDQFFVGVKFFLFSILEILVTQITTPKDLTTVVSIYVAHGAHTETNI